MWHWQEGKTRRQKKRTKVSVFLLLSFCLFISTKSGLNDIVFTSFYTHLIRLYLIFLGSFELIRWSFYQVQIINNVIPLFPPTPSTFHYQIYGNYQLWNFETFERYGSCFICDYFLKFYFIFFSLVLIICLMILLILSWLLWEKHFILKILFLLVELCDNKCYCPITKYRNLYLSNCSSIL